MKQLEELFTTIRKACSPPIWSRGVELARSGAVSSNRMVAEGDIELRVSMKSGNASPLVTLNTEFKDWSCECPSRDDVCLHVAAAVIAYKQARLDNQPLPGQSETAAGKILYHFTRGPAGLSLERFIAGANGAQQKITSTIAALKAQNVITSQNDLGIEVVLGSYTRGPLNKILMPKILALLNDCPDVTLDGDAVAVKDPCPTITARLDDYQPSGFRIRIVQNPSIREIFANGVVLCSDGLRAIADPQLSQQELNDYKHGKIFTNNEVVTLVTQVVPSLRRRLPLDIRTDKLPQPDAIAKPKIVIDTTRNGNMLSAFATLVYCGTDGTVLARIDGDKLTPLSSRIPKRDVESELRLMRRLTTVTGLNVGVRAVFQGTEGLDFVERVHNYEDADFTGTGHESYFKTAPLVPQLQVSSNDFTISFASHNPAAPEKSGIATPSAVLEAYANGESLVPLLEGGFAPLPTAWLARYGTHISNLLAAKQEQAQLPKAALFDLGKLCEDLDSPVPEDYKNLRVLLDQFTGIPTAPLPKDLQAVLRPYQQQGVDWLSYLAQAGLGALLADDMGLGKTLQTLCAVRGKTLVVAPTSVIHNWANEVARFRPTMRCCLFHGASRKLDADADIVLTSYALLRIENDALCNIAWDTVVLDEAQNIKNPDSQAARSAYKLNAQFRIALSGTPIENRLEELWSLFRFTNPGFLGNRSDFAERYTQPINNGNEAAANMLRQRIRPLVMRRLKRDVAKDLPPRTDMVLRCELSQEERQIYDAMRAATRQDVLDQLANGGNVLQVLEVLLRLRQAACHSALLPGQQAEHSSKVRLLVETLSNVVADNHKALIFSQWTSFLDLIEPHLNAAQLPFVRLDGSTPNRMEIVDKFQNDADTKLMLLSLKAGGTGLNLTAADHVFLLDPWWNPAVEDQAADRAHRIGQDKPVFVTRLVATDTVEERILLLQEHKRTLAQAALEHGAATSSITRQELLELLN